MGIFDITKSKETNNLIKLGAVITGIILVRNALKKSGYNPDFSNPFGGTGQGVNQRPGCNISVFRTIELEKIADEIYDITIGVAWMYYPEITDKIIPLDDCELFYVHDYFLANHGYTVFEAIDGEWDFGYYDGARNRLKQAGLNN